MRITKLVREYIEDSVAKKFAPAQNAANKKYAETERAYNEAVKAAKKEAKEVWAKHLAPFYSPEDLESLMNDHTEHIPSSYRTKMGWTDKRNEEIQKIKDLQEGAIKDICLTLELGGTKADLDRMLAEINIDAEGDNADE